MQEFDADKDVGDADTDIIDADTDVGDVDTDITANEENPTAPPLTNEISDAEKKFDMYTAMVDPHNDKPIPFSDVIDVLSPQEKLPKGDFIAYIGSGNFAVIRKGKGRNGVTSIVKVIEYEKDHGERASWRVDLRYESE